MDSDTEFLIDHVFEKFICIVFKFFAGKEVVEKRGPSDFCVFGR